MQREQDGRLFYLDNIKIFLTILVIVHHVGQAYGPTGGFWPFRSSLEESIPMLGLFFSVNAAFFMGFFFFISGYFIPMSYDHGNGDGFLRKRLLRLGVPLLFVFLIMSPLQMYFHYTLYSGNEPLSFFKYITTIWFGIHGMPEGFIEASGIFPEMNFGHAWFIQHLLVYAAFYWLFRKIIKKPLLKQEERPFSALHLFVIFFVIAVSSFIVRIWYPIDYWRGLFGFFQVEIAHWPQYLVMFIVGIIAYRKNWLVTLKARTGYAALVIAILNIVVYATLVIITLNTATRHADVNPWPPVMEWGLIWAVWESFIAVSIIFGLLTLFREKGNWTTPFLKTLSRSSYAAFIFHMPIVLAVQYAFDRVVIGGAVGKFITVSIISIVVTYTLSTLLVKVKLLGKIL